MDSICKAGLVAHRRRFSPARRLRGLPPSVATRGAFALTLAVVGAGCSLAPPGTEEERASVSAAGAPYEVAVDRRVLPELPDAPRWEQVLNRAFLADGKLEAAYFEWRAAVDRIGIASEWPNTRIMLGYSVALGPGQMKAFDRMTLSAGFDPMQNLSNPSKVRAAGRLTLDRARAAGERFRAAKFDLQRRVLSKWANFGLLAERERIQGEQVSLAHLVLAAARSRVTAGGAQTDLERAEIEGRTAEDQQRSVAAELRAARAELNALLAREPEASLIASPAAPRPLLQDDASLLASAVEQNSELAALAHDVAAGADALEKARLEWVPDVTPFASLSAIEQTLGVSVVLPTTVRQIEGGIREADAMVRGADATLRQERREKAASFVATLVLLRDAERRAELFESRIVPAATRIASTIRKQYAASAATYADLVESERAVLDSKELLARVRAAREQRLAELEELMGADVETLGGRT